MALRSSQVPAGKALLRRFSRAAAQSRGPFLSVDERNFISAALKRDAAPSVRDRAGTLAPACPASGMTLSTSGLLWPAVYTVAREMVFSSRVLTYPQVALTAEVGMAQARGRKLATDEAPETIVQPKNVSLDTGCGTMPGARH